MNTKPIRGSSAAPDHIMISFCGDPTSSMAVTWRTDASVTDGYVEYRTEGGAALRAEALCGPYTSDIDSSCMHWAILEGLESGERYYYTCGDDKNRSGEYSFRTFPADAKKVKFIAVSDFQKAEPFDAPDYSAFNKFLKKALEDNPDVSFILSAGDSTDCGEHEQQWNGLFATGLKGIVESVPFMAALGNHDNRGFKDYRSGTGRFYAEPAILFGAQFRRSYPFNGPEGWETENYSFDIGPVHLTVFGINAPDEVDAWAKKDIGGTDRPWKLGVYHFPIYYSGTDCENDDAYPHMRGSMEMLDVMFSGHEHNFSRSFPMRNESIYDRPSEGTVHYMLGNGNCNPPGSRTVSKVWHAAFYPQEEQVSAYALIEADEKTLKLTEILDDGRIVDECTVDKEADAITPRAVAPVFNRPRMMFKGMDPGLSQVNVWPECIDGVWYICPAVLASFIGAEILREKGRVTVELYGHRAVFTEGSAEVETEKGVISASGTAFRGRENQIYVTADVFAEALGMKWAYAQRNNFLSFEHESEAHPVPKQP